MSDRLRNLPLVTDLALVIMVVVYALMTMAGGASNTQNLVAFGAKFNPLIMSGQWWRLVTPIFIHMNFTHILFNGITLYYVGLQLERLFGHFRFLVLFLASGIGGNLASFAFSSSLSAGSSTAIFGLFGAFLMIGEAYWENPVIRRIAKIFMLFIVLNLAFDLLTPGVDIAGHLGGLVTGFLAAYGVGLPHRLYRNWVKRSFAVAALIILVLIVLYHGISVN